MFQYPYVVSDTDFIHSVTSVAPVALPYPAQALSPQASAALAPTPDEFQEKTVRLIDEWVYDRANVWGASCLVSFINFNCNICGCTSSVLLHPFCKVQTSSATWMIKIIFNLLNQWHFQPCPGPVPKGFGRASIHTWWASRITVESDDSWIDECDDECDWYCLISFEF